MSASSQLIKGQKQIYFYFDFFTPSGIEALTQSDVPISALVISPDSDVDCSQFKVPADNYLNPAGSSPAVVDTINVAVGAPYIAQLASQPAMNDLANTGIITQQDLRNFRSAGINALFVPLFSAGGGFSKPPKFRCIGYLGEIPNVVPTQRTPDFIEGTFVISGAAFNIGVRPTYGRKRLIVDIFTAALTTPTTVFVEGLRFLDSTPTMIVNTIGTAVLAAPGGGQLSIDTQLAGYDAVRMRHTGATALDTLQISYESRD